MALAPFTEAITFLQTRDLAATRRFYAEGLGLACVVDQGDCVIFRVTAQAYLGFCERAAAPEKPEGVIFTFVTEDVDGWGERLRAAGAVVEKAPALNPRYEIYNGFFRDPNGYLLEVQRFLDPHWQG